MDRRLPCAPMATAIWVLRCLGTSSLVSGSENQEMQGGLVNQSRSVIELGVSPRVVLSGPDDWCQEQFELAQALVDAGTKVNIAMQNVENARNVNIDRKPHALVLRDARIEARRAVAALDKYKKEHRYAQDSAAPHLGAF